MEKFDQKIPVRMGAICAGAIIALSLVMYIFYETIARSFVLFGLIFLGMLIFAIVMGAMSGVKYRRENGGIISFGHAFGAVYIVFIFYALGANFSQLLITKVIDRDYPAKLARTTKESVVNYMERQGASDTDIEKATEKMTIENFDPPVSKILTTAAGWLVGWAVVALIIAAILKRSPADLADANSQ